MSNGSETLTLDKAFEFAYQIEHVLEAVSDPKWAEALGRIREMLERAVEVRDQMVSLDKSRGEARQHYEMLLQQTGDLESRITVLKKEEADLKKAVAEKGQALKDVRDHAKRMAEELAQ